MASNCREAHCLRASNSVVDRVACGGSSTHPANGSSGPRAQGYQELSCFKSYKRLDA